MLMHSNDLRAITLMASFRKALISSTSLLSVLVAKWNWPGTCLDT